MDEVISGLLRPSGARPWWIVAFAVAVTVRHAGAVARHVGGRPFGGCARHADRCAGRAHRSFAGRECARRSLETSPRRGSEGARQRSTATVRRSAQMRVRTLAKLSRHDRGDRRLRRPRMRWLLYADERAGGRFDDGPRGAGKTRGGTVARDDAQRPGRHELGRRRRSGIATVHARVPAQRRKSAELELELGEAYLAGDRPTSRRTAMRRAPKS